MYRWCTDEVEPHDRFDYWREVRAKGLFGVTAELERERRADFYGEFSLRQLGGGGLVELKASHYTVERSTVRHRLRARRQHLRLSAARQRRLVRRHARQRLRDRQWRLRHQPYRPALSHRAAGRRRLPPADPEDPRERPVHAGQARRASLRPRTFDDPALAPLLGACFADLGEAAAGDDGAADATSLVQALAHLALIERGIVRPGSRLGQAALRTARLSQARRLIARHLQDPDLAPAMVADLLGVSVRHLHMLFETAAKSFSQTVTDERLKQSRRLMREAPDRLIADIATSCGFESLATYYRVFNAAYGMAPGDFRAQGPEGR